MSLTFAEAYHLRCELELNSGRPIVLDRLFQERTYAGMLAGVPSSRTNDLHIEGALERAHGLCVPDARPHLLAPPRRNFLRVPGDMVGSGSQWHVPEWLPQVTCIAEFHAIAPARDSSQDGSALTIVWFQEEFAPPIQEPALSALLNLDWDRLATDFSW